MKRYTRYNPTGGRFIKMLLLPVVILLPTFVMSCGMPQTESDLGQGIAKKSVEIEDLGVSLKLPEGWTEYHEPIRKTLADRMDQLSEEEQKTVVADNPEKLEHGVNFYSYNNLDSYGSIPEEDLFGYFLTIEMHDYFNEERRELWMRGQCGPDEPCEASFNPGLTLIKALSDEENPFESGTGFLYEVETGEEDALPRSIYIYYVVKGEKCYRIMFDGLARDLERGAYSELLADIEFTSL